MPEWIPIEWIGVIRTTIGEISQDFRSEVFWFFTSLVASYLIIPRAIEARQKRALRRARAIVLNRANQLHQAVAAYAAALTSFAEDLDHPTCAEARDRVTSLLRHFRRSAEELSPVLRGKLGASYYAYRLDVTALLGTLADKFDDYRGREIQTVMLYDPPQNKRFDRKGVKRVDALYRQLRKDCGRDLHFSMYTWSVIDRCWSEEQIQYVLDALKLEGLTPAERAGRLQMSSIAPQPGGPVSVSP